jgi:methylmalonyl-CoA decarboxylase subunit alpha
MEEKKRISASKRVEMIFDEDSVFYLGSKINGDGGGVLTGYGTISKRLGFFFSQDYSIKGGAITAVNAKKISRIYDLAAENGAPVIGIFDSCGAVVTDGLDILSAYGSIIARASKYSGVIPQVSLVAGPATGMLSICSAISDFTIVIESFGEMYINSPEALTKKEESYIFSEDYAVSSKLSLNGSAVITAKDDSEGIDYVKKVFSYIPSNNLEYAEEPIAVNFKKIDNIDNIDELVTALSENQLEINKEFEEEIMTSLVKLNGRTIGIIGVGRLGQVSLNSAKIEKITRMVKLCDCYNIPILSLVNSTGFECDLTEEKKGLILSAAKLAAAVAGAKVPKVSLVTGKAIGASYTLLADKEMGFDLSYAAEKSEISLTETKALIAVLYKEELKNAEDKKEKLRELIDNHKEELSSAKKAAEKGLIDEVLDINQVYEVISASFEMLSTKRVVEYPKKHGSILV